MTEMLAKAISEVRQLPEIDQDAIAHFILAEEDERRWDATFAHPKSPLLLEKLLAEAEAGQDCDDTEPS